jgi:hypothetical protein
MPDCVPPLPARLPTAPDRRRRLLRQLLCRPLKGPGPLHDVAGAAEGAAPAQQRLYRARRLGRFCPRDPFEGQLTGGSGGGGLGIFGASGCPSSPGGALLRIVAPRVRVVLLKKIKKIDY